MLLNDTCELEKKILTIHLSKRTAEINTKHISCLRQPQQTHNKMQSF